MITLLLFSQINLGFKVLNPKESYGAEPIIIAVIFKNTEDTVIKIPGSPVYPNLGGMLWLGGEPLAIKITDAQGQPVPVAPWFFESHAVWPPPISPRVKSGIAIPPGCSLIVVDDLRDHYRLKPEGSPYTLWGAEFNGAQTFCLPYMNLKVEARLDPPFVFQITEPYGGLYLTSVDEGVKMLVEKGGEGMRQYYFEKCKRLYAENPPAGYCLSVPLQRNDYSDLIDTLRSLFPNHPYLSDEYWWWLPQIQKRGKE